MLTLQFANHQITICKPNNIMLGNISSYFRDCSLSKYPKKVQDRWYQGRCGLRGKSPVC